MVFNFKIWAFVSLSLFKTWNYVLSDLEKNQQGRNVFLCRHIWYLTSGNIHSCILEGWSNFIWLLRKKIPLAQIKRHLRIFSFLSGNLYPVKQYCFHNISWMTKWFWKSFDFWRARKRKVLIDLQVPGYVVEGEVRHKMFFF